MILCHCKCSHLDLPPQFLHCIEVGWLYKGEGGKADLD